MQQHSVGKLPAASTLTLGGGGIGMVWGETTLDECVATVHAAVAAGINLIDLAPRYGDGKAEQAVGEAFAGRLPDGVGVTSKCNLGNPSLEEIEPLLRRSIEGSLERPATIAARSLFSPFECSTGRKSPSAAARCREPHDALRDLCRACPPTLRALGRRGCDQRVGADRHWPPGHDHQIVGGSAR